MTKKFVRAAESVILDAEGLPELLFAGSEHTMTASTPAKLEFARDCPVCGTPAGGREQGRYFTQWADSCKVQTGNLLYETGLILWGLLKGLPSWATGEYLTALNELRHKVVIAYRAASMMECPQCGRPVTCLFGGTEAKQGFCRHCADMGGGLGVGLQITIDEDLFGDISIDATIVECDPKAPAQNSRDVLPPDALDE